MMCIFIDIDKMKINEEKFEDIAVTSMFDILSTPNIKAMA